MIGGLVAAYVLYAALLVGLHPRVIYPFAPQVLDDPAFSARQIAGPDGPVTVYLNAAPEGAPVILYFMGNAGALAWFLPMLRHHDMAGRQVVALGYPGGGGLPGRPSEAALKRAALAVYDALPDLLGPGHGTPVVQGYSLGTGLAVHVAARREVAGVLLSAPFARLCELMTAASGVPACWLPGVQRWNSLPDAAAVRAPALVLHGTEDRLVPPGQGRRLAGALQGARFVPVPRAGHTDLFGTPPYLAEIDEFLSRPDR